MTDMKKLILSAALMAGCSSPEPVEPNRQHNPPGYPKAELTKHSERVLHDFSLLVSETVGNLCDNYNVKIDYSLLRGQISSIEPSLYIECDLGSSRASREALRVAEAITSVMADEYGCFGEGTTIISNNGEIGGGYVPCPSFAKQFQNPSGGVCLAGESPGDEWEDIAEMLRQQM